ncbi:OmpA family protein [Erythrobacter mangrovi]|uniref:OmpA family protein n=1 Tax=Erythrobacter mangrovi TaxID=2739433 RepID=A0A7D4ATE9_9SPHN|nr:OmpA family protein [Erythrobacter mangrovi]QKG70997.1 OmpA family protein [Erythrobacter mangrovi]
MTVKRSLTAGLGLALLGALAACGETTPQTPQPKPTGDAKSIFRPEFQIEPIAKERPPQPLDTRIFFPEGSELTEAARAELATVVNSQQAAAGGPIVLRGHADAGGNDAANLRISRERAEAVRSFLVDNGIDEARISVIAFGEQNPIAPNALPDGTPNEEGRARNRRVDLHIDTPAPVPKSKEPTLAETLSAAAEREASVAPSE